VVGTTADYIDWIRTRSPESALFLTEPGVRREAYESCPTPAEEILCDLSDDDKALWALQQHLHAYGQVLNGVACFDCESMELAAVLSQDFGLPYPSVQAVKNCRDKYRSKTLWLKQGLKTPQVKLIRSANAAVDFYRDLKDACVLKPLSGSGSELIFHCEDIAGCEQGFRDIHEGLQQRRENRLYASSFSEDPVVLAEALVRGDEYSCDFVIENGRADVIRLTRKLLSQHGPFGTALGYLLPGELPEGVGGEPFLETLVRSAHALGIERAVCMLDFIVKRDQIYLLELTPRPGGDCLPFLLRHCWNLDIVKSFLDFSRGRPFPLEKKSDPCPCIGLRLHASIGGTLKTIDVHQLKQDKRVAEVYVKQRPGHRIKMPPEDYDSWILGHVIFHPDGHSDHHSQCRELVEKLKVEIE
jgi:biotin carboxylase